MMFVPGNNPGMMQDAFIYCLLYTSDAADELRGG